MMHRRSSIKCQMRFRLLVAVAITPNSSSDIRLLLRMDTGVRVTFNHRSNIKMPELIMEVHRFLNIKTTTSHLGLQVLLMEQIQACTKGCVLLPLEVSMASNSSSSMAMTTFILSTITKETRVLSNTSILHSNISSDTQHPKLTNQGIQVLLKATILCMEVSSSIIHTRKTHTTLLHNNSTHLTIKVGMVNLFTHR